MAVRSASPQAPAGVSPQAPAGAKQQAEAGARQQGPGQASNQLTATVVICTYTENRWADLVSAVGSLRAQTRPPDEIVVVVDHNPALLTRVRGKFPGLTAVENRFQQGLSGGKNTAVEVSTCSVILFLDDDAEAAPDWLETVLDAFSDPLVLGVGCRVIGKWEGSRPNWFPPEFDWVVGCTYRGIPQQASRIRNPLGGAMGIRRQVMESTAGFRSDLGRLKKIPLGCEETELCIRAGRNWPGGYFIQQPCAVARHRVPAERQTFSYFRRRCFAEGMSKAMVSRFVGAGDGLAAERRHILTAIPAGVIRGVGEAAGGDFWGAVRAAAIVAGLAFTVAGYAAGTLRSGIRSRGECRD